MTSASTGQLLLIDPQSNRITQAVEIGNGPAGVAVGGGYVWVADTADGVLSRFDPGTGTLSKVNVGKAPVGVAYGAGAVWVTDSLDGTIARVDPTNGSVLHIRVGDMPTALATTGDAVWTTVLSAPAAHRGGTLKVVEENSPFVSYGRSVDPARFAGMSQWQILSLTNDGLVTYRRVGGLAGSTLVPDLATTLPTPTANGLTYTFRLRSGPPPGAKMSLAPASRSLPCRLRIPRLSAPAPRWPSANERTAWRRVARVERSRSTPIAVTPA